MTRRLIQSAAIGAALLASVSAHAAFGIGQSLTRTWEQVRFYAPSGGANAIYLSGQPTYYGVVGSDACPGSDTCGDTMTFATAIGGALTVTATDDGNGASNSTQGIVYQDISPNYGGLGVMSQNVDGGLSGEDEINYGDTLTLSFANKVKIVGFHFWDKDHRATDLNAGDKFGLSIDGGATNFYALSNFAWYGANTTLVGNSFTFSYKNEDYYLGAIKVAAVSAVPEPQTYALMLAGLAAVGFLARRRRPLR